MNTITENDARFTGGVLPIFLFPFWVIPFMLITLGIALPWVISIVIKWICDYTTIGGKRFKFNGTGGGLFGKYIIWWLLSIITLGIYSFWAIKNEIRWVVENIEMVNDIIIEYKTTHKVKLLTNSDGMSLRRDPNAYQEAFCKIPNGTEVQFIEQGKKADLNGIQGFWYKIKTKNDQIGWCFSGSLIEI